MKRVLLGIGLLTCAASVPLHSQLPISGSRAPAATPAAVHAHLKEKLYKDIPLTIEQFARVDQIIDLSLAAIDSALHDPHRQDKWTQIIAQRNASLRAVCKTETERKTFDVNLARKD